MEETLKRVLNRAPGVALLDTRNKDLYQHGHITGSSNVPLSQITDRSAELPPKGKALWVVCLPEEFSTVELQLKKMGYRKVETIVANEQLWPVVEQIGCFEQGSRSVRMWQPNPFLQQCVDKINETIGKETKKSALDLACGSGRDAVYLSENGWNVTAIDYLQKLLDRCKIFAQQANVPEPKLYCWDIESLHKEKPLHLRLPLFDLIHVSRYLHRELMDSIKKMIKPGGFIIYSTFMAGVEEFGKPKNPKFILKQQELKQIFSEPEFICFDYREARIEDFRPLQYIFCRKLPSGVTISDIVRTSRERLTKINSRPPNGQSATSSSTSTQALSPRSHAVRNPIHCPGCKIILRRDIVVFVTVGGTNVAYCRQCAAEYDAKLANALTAALGHNNLATPHANMCADCHTRAPLKLREVCGECLEKRRAATSDDDDDAAPRSTSTLFVPLDGESDDEPPPPPPPEDDNDTVAPVKEVLYEVLPRNSAMEAEHERLRAQTDSKPPRVNSFAPNASKQRAATSSSVQQRTRSPTSPPLSPTGAPSINKPSTSPPVPPRTKPLAMGAVRILKRPAPNVDSK